MIIFLLIIDALLTIVPFVLTGIYYNSMPDTIPLFVNFMGEPSVLAEKTLLTAFRLPLMALILQAVCLAMYLGCRKNAEVDAIGPVPAIKKPGTAIFFRNFWLAASLTIAIKLSTSSLPFTGLIPVYMIPAFRFATVAAALIGVIYLMACLASLYKTEGNNLVKIFMPAGRAGTAVIIALLALYAVVVFMSGNSAVKPPMPQ